MRQATEEIFRNAALAPVQNLLDVGTGAGSPALEAIALVGPAGKVTGIDSAPSMIATARRRAREAGVENAAFVEMEAECLTFPDDRAEEHTSEPQSLMRNTYAGFCLKKKRKCRTDITSHQKMHSLRSQ